MSSAVLAPAGELRNRKGIENYTAFWDRDSSKDTAENTEERIAAYTDVVNGYYDGATAYVYFLSRPSSLARTLTDRRVAPVFFLNSRSLYEYGWGTSVSTALLPLCHC